MVGEPVDGPLGVVAVLPGARTSKSLWLRLCGEDPAPLITGYKYSAGPGNSYT